MGPANVWFSIMKPYVHDPCSGTILHCRLTKRDVERPKGVTPYHQTVLEVETVPIFSLTMFLEEMLS